MKNNHQGLVFEKLTRATLDEAVYLNDLLVGENLHPREEIAEALSSSDKFFYFLRTDKGETVGYISFNLAGVEEQARLAKISTQKIHEIAPGGAIIGNLSSSGVLPQYREHGYSALMIGFALDYLKEKSQAEVAMGVCWRMGEKVPIKGILERAGFEFLCDSRLVWYDNEKLICPYCRGRCVCSAAIYYKKLR